jgi:cell division septation protein DedD
MKIFLSFFLGLLAGIFSSMLTYKFILRRENRPWNPRSRIRPPAQASKNIKLSEKGKRWFLYPAAYLIAGAVTLSFLFLMYYGVRTLDEPVPVEVSPSSQVTPVPIPYSRPGSESITGKIAPPEAEDPVVRETPSSIPTEEKADIPVSGAEKSDPQQQASHEKNWSYPFSVKLDAFRTLEGARKSVAHHKKEGRSPYWVKVDLGKSGVWYRVYVGYFKDRKEAASFIRNQDVTNATVVQTPYANLIGSFSSIDGLKDKAGALEDLGFCPYVIRDRNDVSWLFVGAFITKEGVEQQFSELETHGVENRIVNR